MINQLIESGNPWIKPEFKVKILIQKYGLNAGKYHCPVVSMVNGFYTPSGMKYEFMDVKTGKTRKDTSLPSLDFQHEIEKSDKYVETIYFPVEDHIDLEKLVVMACYKRFTGWNETFKASVYIPVEDIRFRVEDKLLRQTKWMMDNLQVGDFVKCSGTRTGDWNKVEKISLNRHPIIFGPKYSKPYDGNMRYASSDNSISRIKRIVRDGVEIEIQE